MTLKIVKFERLALYEKVWSTPISRLAVEFGMSDVGLRKICKRLAIPLPGLGYWAKIQHGRSLPKPPLPKFDGETTYVHTRQVDDEEDLKRQKVEAALDAAGPRQQPLIALRSDEAEFHPLVKRIARSLRKPGPGDRGLQHSRPPDAFRIAVSAESIPRLLRILDGLWTGLDQIGARTLKSQKDGDWLQVQVDGESLGLQIQETTRRHERALTADEKREMEKHRFTYIRDRYSWESTGRLNLTIVSTSGNVLARYNDGREKLEDKLSEIVVAFQHAAVGQRISREAAEAAAHRRAEEEKIRRAKAQIADKELRRLRLFESCAKQLERAQRLRALADTLEKKNITLVVRGDDANTENQMQSGLSQVAWLRRAADWLDPASSTSWPEVEKADNPYWWMEYQRAMGAAPEYY
jgi:hypothetical protein